MNKNTHRFFLVLLLAVNLLAACQTQTAPQPAPTLEKTYFPAASWRTSSPEEQGLDPGPLADMLALIDQRRWPVDHIAIIRHGYLIFEESLNGYRADTPHLIYSDTKSVSSALIGIAIDQGYIAGVGEPLVSFFPDRVIQNLDDQKQAITLEDLLTMTAGFDCMDSYLYNWRGLNEMLSSDDWTQHVLDLPMAHEPGTYFEYCNGVSFLLSAIVQQATGMQAAQFAEHNLFTPIGIEEYFWDEDPDGVTIGFSELYLKPADMARIGYLYLHHGTWNGRQVISSEWVAASTTTHIAAGTLQEGYGYQWWIDAAGYYMALGHRGQFIFVLPEYDMVVVFLSDPEVGNYDAPEFLLTEYIIPAVQK